MEGRKEGGRKKEEKILCKNDHVAPNPTVGLIVGGRRGLFTWVHVEG